MAERNDIVKLAIDGYKGTVEKYSVGQSQEALREKLIEVNNGKNHIDIRDIRDGKCNGLFTLVEEILGATVQEGLTGNEFFNALVEYKDVPLGDKPVFRVKDSNLFVVDKAADGTQSVRRQRLAGESSVQIDTEVRTVRIYEELNRVLSGAVDFNELIDKVAESYRKQMLDDIYTLWTKASAKDFGGETYFPEAGVYDEDALLELIEHVEAAAGGKPAVILGTKKACRKLAAKIQSESAKEDLYNMGYYGKFFGTPVIVTPQRHKVGSKEFVFDDNVLTIIAGDEKPIKFVNEGEPIILPGNPANNADLTQEYLYGQKYGLGIVVAAGNAGIGRYEMSGM